MRLTTRAVPAGSVQTARRSTRPPSQDRPNELAGHIVSDVAGKGGPPAESGEATAGISARLADIVDIGGEVGLRLPADFPAWQVDVGVDPNVSDNDDFGFRWVGM